MWIRFKMSLRFAFFRSFFHSVSLASMRPSWSLFKAQTIQRIQKKEEKIAMWKMRNGNDAEEYNFMWSGTRVGFWSAIGIIIANDLSGKGFSFIAAAVAVAIHSPAVCVISWQSPEHSVFEHFFFYFYCGRWAMIEPNIVWEGKSQTFIE